MKYKCVRDVYKVIKNYINSLKRWENTKRNSNCMHRKKIAKKNVPKTIWNCSKENKKWYEIFKREKPSEKIYNLRWPILLLLIAWYPSILK